MVLQADGQTKQAEMCADSNCITYHHKLRSVSKLRERKTTATSCEVAFKTNVHLILDAFLLSEE